MNPSIKDSERLADNIDESDAKQAKVVENAQLVDQKLRYQEKIMEDMFLSVNNTEEDLSAYYTHLLNTMKLSDRQVTEALNKAKREQLTGQFISGLLKGAVAVGTAALGMFVASSIANAALPDASKEELPPPTDIILDDGEIEKITKEPDAEPEEGDVISDGDILVEADQIIFEAEDIEFPEQEEQGSVKVTGQPSDYKEEKKWHKRGSGSSTEEGSGGFSGGESSGSGGQPQRMPSGSPAPQDASPAAKTPARTEGKLPSGSPAPQQSQSGTPTKEPQPEARKDGTKVPRMSAEQARAFMNSRNPRGSKIAGVDNRLIHSMAEGIRLFEKKYGDRYRVEMFGPSGGTRSGHGGSHHHRGGALDIVIVDKQTGKQLTNYPHYSHMQGSVGETAPIYQKLANEVKTAHEAHYPGQNLRWGGYGKWGEHSLDLMHFDFGRKTGKGGGHGGGEFESGFTRDFMRRYGIRENVPLPNPEQAAKQAYQEPQQQPTKKAEEPPAIVGSNRKSAEVPAIVDTPTDSRSVPAIVD